VSLFHLPGRGVGTLDDGRLFPGDGYVSTILTRDRLGRVIKSKDADQNVTQFHYDGLSRLIRRIDALGNATVNVYDKAGNPISRESQEKSDLFASVESFLWASEYDALNRLARSVEPNGQQMLRSWDSRGNLVRTTDHLGNQVELRHDRLSRLVDQRTYLSASGLDASAATADPSQGGGDGRIQLRQSWDPVGRLKTRTDDNDNTTTFTYDGMSRLLRTDFQDGTFDLRTYNLDSELQTFQRQNGTVLNWTHDAEGRALSVSVAPGTGVTGTLSQTWGRDGLGRVTLSTDDNGEGRDVACEFYYDSLSRLIRETQDIGSGYIGQVDSQWSGLRRVTDTYPDGRTLTRTHDALGRVTRIRPANGPAIAALDFVGPRLARLVQGERITLDKRNTELTGTLGGTDPGYDLNGRDLNHFWRNTIGQTLIGLHYTYNGTGGAGTNRITGEYRTEPLGIPTGARQATYLLDSAYREVGFERTGMASSSRTLDGANKMTAFDDRGIARSPEVDEDPGEAGLNQYSSLDLQPQLYGLNGDLRSDGSKTYLYDAFDRLVEVKSAADGTSLAMFEYDAGNRRVTAAAGENRTRFISMGWQVVEERAKDETVLRQYVASSGLDSHVQMLDVTTGRAYYYQSTPLGTIAGLSDEYGNLVEAYDYGWLGTPEVSVPGGTTVGTQSTYGNPHLFQGREWDAGIELYQFRNRYYSPSIGEFTTIDPSGLWAHGMGNGYDGFMGSPSASSDRMGLQPRPRLTPDGEVDEWATFQAQRAAAAQDGHQYRSNWPATSPLLPGTTSGAPSAPQRAIQFWDTRKDVAGAYAASAFTMPPSDPSEAAVLVDLDDAMGGTPARWNAIIPPLANEMAKRATQGAQFLAEGAAGGLADDAARCAAKGSKPFAMGLTNEGRLDEFARTRGATTWKELPDPARWKTGVLDKLADPTTQVHFNLDGVDAWQGASRAAAGRGGPTDWELLTIQQNPQFWESIQFWKGGVPVTNPFK
jgi:RHS repeat-associated protein